jgi:hypothetical protein
MKKTGFIVLAFFYMLQLQAQDVFITRHGQISFFSKTPLENIDAVNNEVSSALNLQSGEVGFAVLIRSFHFERALMEEHFNENYMESDNIPKASFKGKINNPASVTVAKDGTYNVTAEGDLTIHGVTKKVSIPGTITVKSGQLELVSKFKIAPKDYNIKIPSLVADKIADAMNVSVDCKYEKK